MLTMKGVNASYGSKQVLFEVSLRLAEREIVALIGPNGAGKSTVLRAIFGLVRQSEGSIDYRGEEILGRRPDRNVGGGIAFVQQGARVFGGLTVAENLLMAGFSMKDRKQVDARSEEVLVDFPRLRERYQEKATSLSGGERQSLAFGMALMQRPRLLLIDEPSIGLAPKLITQMFDTIVAIRERLGTAILIVEQQAQQALRIADSVVVLRAGAVIGGGPAADYRDPEVLRKVYLRDSETQDINNGR
jgi:branched-chain amino acid transport system ATP-binding protein